MKRSTINIAALTALTLLAVGCKRNQETNKIIDNLPVSSNIVVTPALAAQQMLLLKGDLAKTIVPIVNRLGLLNQSYPELTGPNGYSEYTFQRTESHYGTVTFTVQFRDGSNAIIDPIQTQTSSTTVASVVIGANGSSGQFNYTENMRLTLATVGDTLSNKLLTGTSGFTGSSYSVTFTLASPGVKLSFDGYSEGTLTASGSGGPNSDPTTLSLSCSVNHTSDGSISWEGQQGGIHFNNDGTGYIATNQTLILIN